jgi:hypothetical protein
MHPVRNHNPASYRRVAVFKYPNIFGPTNPPRLPNELIVPIAVAAAALPRNAEGRVQKTGRCAWKREANKTEEGDHERDMVTPEDR